MKLRTAPLDDVHQELSFVLEHHCARPAQFLLRLFRALYRIHCRLMLAALRHLGQGASVPVFPEIGREPFNLTDDELEELW